MADDVVARLVTKNEVIDMTYFYAEESELGKVYVPKSKVKLLDTVTFSPLFMDRLVVTGLKVEP